MIVMMSNGFVRKIGSQNFLVAMNSDSRGHKSWMLAIIKAEDRTGFCMYHTAFRSFSQY